MSEQRHIPDGSPDSHAPHVLRRTVTNGSVHIGERIDGNFAIILLKAEKDLPIGAEPEIKLAGAHMLVTTIEAAHALHEALQKYFTPSFSES